MEKVMRVSSSSSSILTSSSALSVAILTLMLLLFIILILIACKFKPWRRFLSTSTTIRHRTRSSIKVDDIERPLVSEDSVSGIVDSHITGSSGNYLNEGAAQQLQGSFSSPHSLGVAPKQRVQSASPQLTHSGSFILDVPNTSEDSFIGQTLKRPINSNQFAEEWVYEKKGDLNYNSPKYGAENDSIREIFSTSSNQKMQEAFSC